MAKPQDRFHDPHVGISKVYTRTGDAGETGLAGGQRIPKDALRIEAYGTVDELAAVVGVCRASALEAGAPTRSLADVLLRVQHQLFNLGSTLSTLPNDMKAGQPRTTDAEIAWLESEMDVRTAKLPALRSFVLPGPSRLNAELHVARTVARRAERLVVRLRREGGCGDVEARYINRLSDAFFVWSRWASQALGEDENLWQPNQA